MSGGVKARLGLASDLVKSRIVCNDIVPYIKNDIKTLRNAGFNVYPPDLTRAYPKCIMWYVLDSSGGIIIVPEKYSSYLGINLRHLFKQGMRTPLHYISLLSKRSVIGTAYPISHNQTLIVERDLVDIVPTLRYFTSHPLFPQEVIFLLSGSGRAIYYPDENVVNTRQNIAFDMKNIDQPDQDGFFTYRYRDKKYMAMALPFSAPAEWRIYYSLPIEVIYHILREALLLHLSMLLVLTGFIFLLLHSLLKRVFSRPVAEIVHAVEKQGTDHVDTIDPGLAHGILELESILKAIESRDIAVARAAQQLSAVLNSLDAYVYVSDLQTYELLFVNYKVKEWAGDITGSKCHEHIPAIPVKQPCKLCIDEKIINEHGKPSGVYIWEYENTLTDHWFECRVRAIPWIDGRLVRLVTATDITWRKKAERDLFNEKERLAVTLASIGEGVITTDTKGRIILMNPVAEKITGWNLKTARNRTFGEVVRLVEERSEQQCLNPVERAMESGTVTSLDGKCRLVRKDGTWCNVSHSAAPIFDRERKIIGAVVVFSDITEELRTSKELLKVKKLETVGVLAGGIAHDFNNIIAAIMGNIELAQFSLKPSDTPYRQLDNAIKACGRARDLAQQLLTFSKGGAPVCRPTSLPELIKESADFVLHGSNALCTYEFATDLWKAEVDRGQMSQVIQNLVLNSIHAMPDGGRLTIKCFNCTDQKLISRAGLPLTRYIGIEIEDAGTGIPHEIMDKIFEPYFSTRHTGSGLGLAIVHSIIAKHGGAILVDSVQGQGTVFTILMPAAEESEAQKAGNANNEKKAPASPALVLVMDDDPMIRSLARDILKIYGHETIEAEDGRQAVEIYTKQMKEQKPVDMVIMDLTIPGGMGGVEALKRLLEIDPAVSAVVASGYSNDPVMSNYREYGFKGRLIKPFSMKEMGDIVVRLTAEKGNRDKAS